MGQLTQSNEMCVTPYRRLVAAILSGAVQDVQGRKLSNDPKYNKENAVDYLQNYNLTWHSEVIKAGRKIKVFLERRCSNGEICGR